MSLYFPYIHTYPNPHLLRRTKMCNILHYHLLF